MGGKQGGTISPLGGNYLKRLDEYTGCLAFVSMAFQNDQSVCERDEFKHTGTLKSQWALFEVVYYILP